LLFFGCVSELQYLKEGIFVCIIFKIFLI